MKAKPIAAAAVFALSTLVPTRAPAAAGGNGNGSTSTIPSTPIGTFSAYPTVVQTGTNPMLTWNILYPSTVSSLVQVNPPGTLSSLGTTYTTVQIVGSGVTSCDPTQGTGPFYTDVRLSVNGGSYVQLFYGTQADVDPAHVLYTDKLNAGDTLDFCGRYVINGAYSTAYTTRNSNYQVITLVSGQTPPTLFSLYQSSSLAGYLKPYLDASGKVNIGPLSVLVVMELGQTDHTSPCFDYQDVVLLVTFAAHNNNGNGNNLGGVDPSNPGKGHGGPNGLVDPPFDIELHPLK